jgi:hypothetical protein
VKRVTPRKKRHPLAGTLRAVKRIHRVVKAVDRWTGRAQRVAGKAAKKGLNVVRGWVKAHKRAGVAVRAHARTSRPATAQRSTATSRTTAQERPSAKAPRPVATPRPVIKKRPLVQRRPSEAELLLGKELQRISDAQWRQARIERGG